MTRDDRPQMACIAVNYLRRSRRNCSARSANETATANAIFLSRASIVLIAANAWSDRDADQKEKRLSERKGISPLQTVAVVAGAGNQLFASFDIWCAQCACILRALCQSLVFIHLGFVPSWFEPRLVSIKALYCLEATHGLGFTLYHPFRTSRARHAVKLSCVITRWDEETPFIICTVASRIQSVSRHDIRQTSMSATLQLRRGTCTTGTKSK